jgi:hypothetical protein
MKMALGALALLGVLGVSRLGFAQTEPSIGDAELALLCEDTLRESLRARVAVDPGTPSIDDMQQEIDSLRKDEARTAERIKKANGPAAVRAQEDLSELRAQRKAAEQTLSDMQNAAGVDPSLQLGAVAKTASECGDDAQNENARSRVCRAYREHTVIPWDAARQLASCMKRAPRISKRSLARLEEEAPRALGGASLEASILQGTAAFLIKRGEQELTLFATQVISHELCEKGSTRYFLANTCTLVDPPEDSGKDPLIGYTLATLREAARADLEVLPKQLSKKLVAKHSALGCAMDVSWEFSDRVLQGADVVETLSNLGPLILEDLEKTEPCRAKPEFTKKLRELSQGVFAIASLRNVNVDGLVRSAEFNSLVSRADASFTRDAALTPNGSAMAEVLRRVRELQRAIDNLDKSATAANRAAAVAAALRTIDPLLRLAGEKDADVGAYLSTLSEIVVQIGKREYVAAVVTLSSSKLLEDVLPKDEVGHNFHVLLSLGATVAQSDSSGAVQSAIEEAAAPLQSWRRKNMPQWGATITGFVGLTLAYEVPVEKTDDGKTAQDGVSIAPSLLLGIDVHRGWHGTSRLGVFFNLLDLGALATFRLDDPKPKDRVETERAPDIHFEQVFAPGLYPYYGNGPFAFGFAVGFVPSLRPVHETGESALEPLDVLRFGVFAAVDISVLPLF